MARSRMTCPPARGCTCTQERCLAWVFETGLRGTRHSPTNVARYNLRGVGPMSTYPLCPACTRRVGGWPRVRGVAQAPPKGLVK